jgi:1,4-alpha-glucan branching enzyme
MWPIIHAAEERFETVTSTLKKPRTWQKKVLEQAARELLLLQASDWPFLVTTGQAREYASERFRGHVERFHELLDGLSLGEGFLQTVDMIWEKDKIFPEIEYGWFTA